ncbi:hypothetical protein EDD11_006476 [Mortierella claussenii]|nr:hypothetical protein EDD11_006476 [Mortierella claussenii]
MRFQTLTLVFLLVIAVYLAADFQVTWLSGRGIRDIYYYNKRDVYFVLFFILPAMASHLVTIWGHYYRADQLFQESIAKVSTTSIKERRRISMWDRHDKWVGYTYRYWVLVVIVVLLNVMWFVQPLVAYLPRGLKFLGTYGAITAYVAFGTGYAAMGCCGMLLLVILRRSMLHALGFTYADLLPMHRGLGNAFIYWSTIHALCYILYYVHFDAFWDHFNFDGNTRGPQNLIALVAYAALLGLGFTAKVAVRRSCYLLFIVTHRVFTVITFVGTLMHFPYYMIWYYVLPSVCLYLADRFVPKFLQSCSIARKAECSFNKDADILTVVLISRDRMEPLKPYYPGDYVNLEIPDLSMIAHPFTIASYWAEDPYSMTLYIRTFQETKTSWTGALANMCCEHEKNHSGPLRLKANVDGVFGDRNHDYLCTRVMVIFAAGAAITTFMSLLKAIAAQIESTAKMMDNPATIEVYLICTFRYESELYAYGDFMHRIMHDARFTSWLHTQIYISRPDKHTPPPACPSGECISEFVCGRIEDEEEDSEERDPRTTESTSLLTRSSKLRYGAASSASGCCRGGSTTGKECCMESSISSMTVSTTTVADARLPSDADPYQYKSLPTFTAASSASIAIVHAKKDLVVTSMILVLPMMVFLWSRGIPWEGTYKDEQHWCRTTFEFDQHMTNRCLWTYSVLPGVLHIAAASILGYMALWVARSTHLMGCHSQSQETGSFSASSADAYRNLVQGLSPLDPEYDPAATTPTCSSMRKSSRSQRLGRIAMPKGSIQFLRGRIQVNHHIQELKGLGIGCEVENAAVGHPSGVLVFGGGPDAFVDMIEKSCKKTRWNVDFHRETWAP